MSEVETAFRAAVALQRAGEDAQAEAIWRRLLAHHPGLVNARDNLCLSLLAQGKYEEGFPLYDVRFERPQGRVAKPGLSFPEWRGQPLEGRSILVWFEQGLGDQIMHARFARALADRGARVSMLVEPPLVRLFRHLPVEVIEASGQVKIPRHDYWVMAGSLPGRLGVTLQTLPAAPYLPGRDGGEGVGIMVRGRQTPDPGRSLPDEAAEALLALPGARSLAPEATGAKDLQDTADIIAGLSLVITIDTAVAHLAGAMGKPTWLLLPYLADWRWLRGRADSPWYPSMTLFRQPAPGDWDPVIREVVARAPAAATPKRQITQANILQSFHEAMRLQDGGDFAAAADLWAPITAAAPQSAEAHANYGSALLELFRFEEAERELRRAVALKPDAPWAHLGLARFLNAVGRWTEAEAPYRRALAGPQDTPSLRTEVAKLLLGLGKFEEGWPLYESRIGAPGQNAEPLDLPNRWNGEPLTGRSLVIWPEQGFGDQIQFARFAPLLRDQGARVTLVAPPELTALFSTLGVEVVEQSAETTFPQPDYWTLPLSIPGKLGMRPETIPGARYLTAPEDRRRKWADYAPKGAVGIVWKGRGTHSNDANRSLPTKGALAPLGSLGRPIVDLTEPLGDFADVAAVIEQLDVLVTVDTALAHLAGALGRPAFLLLPFYRADWRWMQCKSETPWYHSIKLVRQAQPGTWSTEVRTILSCCQRGEWPSPS